MLPPSVPELQDITVNSFNWPLQYVVDNNVFKVDVGL